MVRRKKEPTRLIEEKRLTINKEANDTRSLLLLLAEDWETNNTTFRKRTASAANLNDENSGPKVSKYFRFPENLDLNNLTNVQIEAFVLLRKKPQQETPA